MTSPSIASVGAGVTSPAGTTLTVVMPASISAGNLLLGFLFLDQNNPGSAYRSQFPAGWTVMDAISQSSAGLTCQAFYKVADGSETNFNLTTSSIISRSRVYRITGHGVGTGTYPVFCGWQGANSASGPNTVANEWPTQDILAILACAWENTTPSGGLSGYTNEFNAGSGTLGARCDTKAISSVNSENPAAYTTGSGNRAGYVCLVPSSNDDPDLTFPIVRNEVVLRDTSGSPVIVLPQQRQPGDICVVVLGLVTNVTVSSGLPSGWTTQVNEQGSGSGGERLYVFWKRLDGTETDFTLTMSGASGNTNMVCCVMNVDSDATVLSASTHNTSSDAAPNPPNLSADSDLWMAVAEEENFALTGYPASYTHKQFNFNGNGSVYVAFRQLSATSENPGTFSIGSAHFWAAATLAFGKANPRHFQAWWSE